MKDEAIELAIEALIKPFEGYARALPNGDCMAYPDPASGGKPWTIGYGSTGPDIVEGTIWTQEQALEALREHVSKVAIGVLGLAPNLATEPSRRLAALISFTYNLGIGNLRISTLLRKVKEGSWEEASEEILKWNKAGGRVLKGLTRRRQAESLFLQ